MRQEKNARRENQRERLEVLPRLTDHPLIHHLAYPLPCRVVFSDLGHGTAPGAHDPTGVASAVLLYANPGLAFTPEAFEFVNPFCGHATHTCLGISLR